MPIPSLLMAFSFQTPIFIRDDQQQQSVEVCQVSLMQIAFVMVLSGFICTAYWY